MNIQNILFLALGLVFITSCATEPQINNINYPLQAIDKAIHSALIKVKKVSQSRREYTSDYLTTDGKEWDPIGNNAFRVTATVTVLNDRRPYDIRIETVVEERPAGKPGYSSGFKKVGESKKLVGEISYRIENFLRQTDNRNLIDDFKPF